MVKLLGIDDAGRGPVIGPMILAGVLIDESQNESLKELGVKDSKDLTPTKRGQIKKELKTYTSHIEISRPKEIDISTNLNYLEAIKAAKIINKLNNPKEKIKVIIDCPSVNTTAWCNDVKNLIKNPENIKLVCEHKADAKYPVVAAASILAKEKREDEIYALKMKLKTDFGSGYPADPKTKKFIKENFNNPKFKDAIRFSWKTVKTLVKEEDSRQKKLF